MLLIVGLGNPGVKYQNTRHNVGFMVLDEFATQYAFPAFKLSKKFFALISERNLNGDKVILAKPQTFMNESGKTARAISSHYKLSNEDILVVHDDIDLPLGKIKISKNSSSAGHKGVDSIIKFLKTKDFVRFRIGIKNEAAKTRDTEKLVLEKFTEEESAILQNILQKTIKSIVMCVEAGLTKAMSECNK